MAAAGWGTPASPASPTAFSGLRVKVRKIGQALGDVATSMGGSSPPPASLVRDVAHAVEDLVERVCALASNVEALEERGLQVDRRLDSVDHRPGPGELSMRPRHLEVAMEAGRIDILERKLTQLSNTMVGSSDSLRREMDSLREFVGTGKSLATSQRDRCAELEDRIAELGRLCTDQAVALGGQKDLVGHLQGEVLLLADQVGTVERVVNAQRDSAWRLEEVEKTLKGVADEADRATQGLASEVTLIWQRLEERQSVHQSADLQRVREVCGALEDRIAAVEQACTESERHEHRISEAMQAHRESVAERCESIERSIFSAADAQRRIASDLEQQSESSGSLAERVLLLESSSRKASERADRHDRMLEGLRQCIDDLMADSSRQTVQSAQRLTEALRLDFEAHRANVGEQLRALSLAGETRHGALEAGDQALRQLLERQTESLRKLEDRLNTTDVDADGRHAGVLERQRQVHERVEQGLRELESRLGGLEQGTDSRHAALEDSHRQTSDRLGRSMKELSDRFLSLQMDYDERRSADGESTSDLARKLGQLHSRFQELDGRHSELTDAHQSGHQELSESLRQLELRQNKVIAVLVTQVENLETEVNGKHSAFEDAQRKALDRLQGIDGRSQALERAHEEARETHGQSLAELAWRHDKALMALAKQVSSLEEEVNGRHSTLETLHTEGMDHHRKTLKDMATQLEGLKADVQQRHATLATSHGESLRELAEEHSESIRDLTERLARVEEQGLAKDVERCIADLEEIAPRLTKAEALLGGRDAVQLAEALARVEQKLAEQGDTASTAALRSLAADVERCIEDLEQVVPRLVAAEEMARKAADGQIDSLQRAEREIAEVAGLASRAEVSLATRLSDLEQRMTDVDGGLADTSRLGDAVRDLRTDRQDQVARQRELFQRIERLERLQDELGSRLGNELRDTVGIFDQSQAKERDVRNQNHNQVLELLAIENTARQADERALAGRIEALERQLLRREALPNGSDGDGSPGSGASASAPRSQASIVMPPPRVRGVSYGRGFAGGDPAPSAGQLSSLLAGSPPRTVVAPPEEPISRGSAGVR